MSDAASAAGRAAGYCASVPVAAIGQTAIMQEGRRDFPGGRGDFREWGGVDVATVWSVMEAPAYDEMIHII